MNRRVKARKEAVPNRADAPTCVGSPRLTDEPSRPESSISRATKPAGIAGGLLLRRHLDPRFERGERL
jgi:hypothetical protein